jgi:hypothetical protein
MNRTVRYFRRGRVDVLCIDNQLVNALSGTVLQGLRCHHL